MVQRGVLHLRNLVRLVALGAQTDNLHLLGCYPLGESMQEQCHFAFTQCFLVCLRRRGAPGQMPGVRLPGSDEADDAETALVGAVGIYYFALHRPPCNRGKGIACKVRVGQIPLHRPQIAENDDVIIFAGRQILLVQKLVDKVVVLVGKNTLSIIQRNIVHKAPPS